MRKGGRGEPGGRSLKKDKVINAHKKPSKCEWWFSVRAERTVGSSDFFFILYCLPFKFSMMNFCFLEM